MTLSKHAKQQLDLRVPGWIPSQLDVVVSNPKWIFGNEQHIYLGTGFDVIGATGKVRSRYKRRHIFLVVQDDTIVTVVFHTTQSIMNYLSKPDCTVVNSVQRPSGGLTKVLPGVHVLLERQHLLTIRPDLYWEYEVNGNLLALNVQSVN